MGQSSVALTSLTAAELAQNMQAVEQLKAALNGRTVSLVLPADLKLLADFLTRLTQLTEGAIAIIFLAPLPQRWRFLREASLLFFFATAYTLLPVAPFAALFSCLGYALTPSERFRAAFIGAFFLYQLMDLRLGSLWGAG